MNSYKLITFDLDTKALEFYYPNKNWNNAYNEIRKFLEKNDFEHIQGSVYKSVIPLEHSDVSIRLRKLKKRFHWLDKSVNGISLTNIDIKVDISDMFSESSSRYTVKEIEAYIMRRLEKGDSLKRIETQFKVRHKCDVKLVKRFNMAKKALMKNKLIDLENSR
ncbi:MAG: hypothetical protein IJA40_05815 [Phascolarctobacterium sp.]|nr:hypothetical protein [Phascolarctobacterium sp.]